MNFLLCNDDIDGLEGYRAWLESATAARAFRRELESKLAASLEGELPGRYHGFCWTCRQHSTFLFDRRYAPPGEINWRERLVCDLCHLNCRLRLSVHLLEQALPDLAARRVYLTEQMTAMAQALAPRCPGLVGSEFLGPAATPGSVDARGLRHEDLTRLSFADGTFDAVLSFDVFEHIPDYRAALTQVRRVLRPGGLFLMTVPFHAGSQPNIVRARVGSDGAVTHLLAPEYHGDPLDPEGGVLCYYHFGWDLLDDMRRAGFASASLSLYWSSDYAYLGNEQIVIRARA